MSLDERGPSADVAALLEAFEHPTVPVERRVPPSPDSIPEDQADLRHERGHRLGAAGSSEEEPAELAAGLATALRAAQQADDPREETCVEAVGELRQPVDRRRGRQLLQEEPARPLVEGGEGPKARGMRDLLQEARGLLSEDRREIGRGHEGVHATAGRTPLGDGHDPVGAIDHREHALVDGRVRSHGARLAR